MGCLSCWDRWYCLGPTCYHTDKLSCQRGCYFWTKGGSAGPGLLPARTGTGLVPLTITWGHEPAPGRGRGRPAVAVRAGCSRPAARGRDNALGTDIASPLTRIPGIVCRRGGLFSVPLTGCMRLSYFGHTGRLVFWPERMSLTLQWH